MKKIGTIALTVILSSGIEAAEQETVSDQLALCELKGTFQLPEVSADGLVDSAHLIDLIETSKDESQAVVRLNAVIAFGGRMRNDLVDCGKDKPKKTPFGVAVQKVYPEVLKLLWCMGADPLTYDGDYEEDPSTIIEYAHRASSAYNKAYNLTHCLVGIATDRNAFRNNKNNFSRVITPEKMNALVDQGWVCPWDDAMYGFGCPKALEILQSTHRRDWQQLRREPYLLLCFSQGRLQEFEEAVAAGASLKTVDRCGRSLFVAMAEDKPNGQDIFPYLQALALTYDFNRYTTYDDATPLSAAVVNDLPVKCIALLLKYGANPRASAGSKQPFASDLPLQVANEKFPEYSSDHFLYANASSTFKLLQQATGDLTKEPLTKEQIEELVQPILEKAVKTNEEEV